MEAVINLQTENKQQAVADQQDVTLSYLFFTFFKIGLISFGGAYGFNSCSAAYHG
jgi:hypothetical protein